MSLTAVTRRIQELAIPGYGEDEVLFMAETMARLWPTHVFEWGTNRGSSARIFHEARVLIGIDCEIHTVELPLELAHLDRDHPGQASGLFIEDIPVSQYLGDGLEVSLRLYAEAEPERALFYLDGCHRYKQVLVELRTLSTAVPEAVLLLHDTGHLPEVARALADFRPERHYEQEHLASQAGMTSLWPRASAW